jgi:hypothetical protein
MIFAELTVIIAEMLETFNILCFIFRKSKLYVAENLILELLQRSSGTLYVDVYEDVLNDVMSPNTVQSVSGDRTPDLSDKWRMTVGRGCYAPPSGSGHVGFCDGQKWHWSRFSPRTSVSPANLHSICFSTIIFTITRGWHSRPGVVAVPIASQTE